MVLLTEEMSEESILPEERVPCTPKQAMLIPIDLGIEKQQSSDSLLSEGYCGRLISEQSYGLAEPIRFLLMKAGLTFVDNREGESESPTYRCFETGHITNGTFSTLVSLGHRYGYLKGEMDK